MQAARDGPRREAAERPSTGSAPVAVRPALDRQFERLALDALRPPGPIADGVESGPVRFADLLTPPPGPGDAPSPGPRRTATPAGGTASGSFAVAWRQRHGARTPAVPPLDVENWERRYKRLTPRNQSLRTAVQLAGAVSVGQLRAAGWDLPRRYADDVPINRLLIGIFYVGAGFAAAFTPAGELWETANGHLMPVEGVSTSKSFRDSGMPGIFLGGPETYAVLGRDPTGRPDVAVRRGRLGLRVSGRADDKARLKAQLSDPQRAVMLVVSESYRSRRSVPAAVAGTVGRLTDAVALCITRDHLRDALGGRLASTGTAELARDALLNLLQRVMPFVDPGAIDDTRRLAMASGMAIWPAANEREDLEVAAQVLAPEIAALLTGAATGTAMKGGQKVAAAVPPTTPTGPPTASPAPPVPSPRHTASGKPVEGAAGEAARATAGTARVPGRGAVPPESGDAPGISDPSARASDHGDRTTLDAAPVRPPVARIEADLTPEGRAAIDAMITKVIRSGEAHRNLDGAADKVKGVILEQYAVHSPEVTAVVETFRRTAHLYDVDPRSVRVTTSVTDVVLPGRDQGLSDGVIYGVRWLGSSRPLPRADERTSRRAHVVVLGFIETKTTGQARELIQEGDASQRGQLERTRARLETGAVTIDGVRYRADQIFSSVDFGRPLKVIAAVPGDHGKIATRNLIREMTSPAVTGQPARGQGRRIQVVHVGITDAAAGSTARALLERALGVRSSPFDPAVRKR